MLGKEILRTQLLRKLSDLSFDEVYGLSYSLTNQIIKFLKIYPHLEGQIGAGYLPLKSEIAPVYQVLLHAVPLNLSYPILKDGVMSFAIPSGMPRGRIWLEGPYVEVIPEWLMIPILGFDWTGCRLGRGKGYYDRYLENSDALRIGLAWSEQLIEEVPVESHDCRMDFIITESFCWDVERQNKF